MRRSTSDVSSDDDAMSEPDETMHVVAADKVVDAMTLDKAADTVADKAMDTTAAAHGAPSQGRRRGSRGRRVGRH